MQNPFESGQIKNYILFYVGIVVIMILFFAATTLFNEPKKIAKKEFNTELNTTQKTTIAETKKETTPKRKYKLLQKGY
jgi:phosphotransferase system  glucose/maltose/N-acetylglucosamine-specific IIC component